MNQRYLLLFFSAALMTYLGMLIWLASSLSPSSAEMLFGESGGFEDMSAVLWLGLAGALLVSRPIRLSRRLGMAVVVAALAAREEGWHKKFTADSLFKTDYYQMAGVPLGERLLAGAVALALIAILLWLLAVGARELFARGGWRRPWGLVALFSVMLAPLLKAVDRGPSILRERFDVVLPGNVDQLMLVLEEGLETALPLLLLVALAFYLGDRRRTHDAHGS